MNVINCPRCHRVFTKVYSPVCPQCEREDEEQFQKLRKYVEENPLANINDISDATEVSPKRILQYLREGRLISLGLEGELRCVQCGIKITEGNFCDSCAAEIAKDMPGMAQATPKTRPKQIDQGNRGSGMHTNTIRKR